MPTARLLSCLTTIPSMEREGRKKCEKVNSGGILSKFAGTSPQPADDLRLSGPPLGQGAVGGARTFGHKGPCRSRAGSLSYHHQRAGRCVIKKDYNSDKSYHSRTQHSGMLKQNRKHFPSLFPSLEICVKFVCLVSNCI
ncbi:hypothetical protein PoB_002074800 [Plakobranchus ocellatus]|uniref:Uncharacterized protein n=1 Tax=Plakobranchus ocellatus TaxID=259542 RepID=A0AAV3ZI90_9GAST|nr:hypothetical protein PoB_002074800 [Plakobranchus ocellatus]